VPLCGSSDESGFPALELSGHGAHAIFRPASARGVVTTEDEPASLSSEVKRLEGEVGTHAHHPLLHLPVFEQLKQRNVFRVAVLYLVVCWLVLDPVHVVFHMLDVAIWANRLVVMLMAVGFPAVVIFAWVYEITPEGLKPTVEVPHHKSIRKLTGRRLDRAIIAVLAVALAYFVIDKFWISRHVAAPQPIASAAPESAARTSAVPPAAAPFAPPPHSIAVLPFVNISGDKEQEYFSDGLTEELLNSLSRINELQVAARTSAFYFKGEHVDLSTVAHKLNVASVLEGSVRRSGHTIRVTAQLNNAVTGYHLWSQTYDRDMSDVLKLQTDIANAVANALKVTLLGDVAGRIEVGGTRNPAAFDAYLRGFKAFYEGIISGVSDARESKRRASFFRRPFAWIQRTRLHTWRARSRTRRTGGNLQRPPPYATSSSIGP
jgi:TolB-like protein